ncbi:P1 family peptidase [Hyphococcus formosus]|uniref:P1 family peptidase n=1 Tax=Hyphococcus formosus TaxID=3143534 RepID=UPI00398B6340
MHKSSVVPGPLNLITDIPSIKVGNASSDAAKTGVTVLRCARSFLTAVDIRGGGPGTRETDTLSPENLVGRADAIVLAGGSVFGLAAADGVAATLSDQKVGLRLGEKGPAIPIVPSAILHDLTNDGDKDWGGTPPYRDLGVEALANIGNRFELGNVGAGMGAMAGSKKGGLGSASIVLENNVTVGALVAVNPVGSVFMPDGNCFYAWPWEIGDEFGGVSPPTERDQRHPFPDHSRLKKAPPETSNTIIAVIATNADLTNTEAKRVAMMAHDGIARAVRPAHTPFDGDTVFAVSTGDIPFEDQSPAARHFEIAHIGSAASDCLARAIARGVYEAQR